MDPILTQNHASAKPAGFTAAIGTSKKRDLLEAVQEASHLCLSRIPTQEVHLAVIFSTPHIAIQSLLTHVRAQLKNYSPLIGCSGMHLITPEGVQKEGLALLLLSLPGVKISCGSTSLGQDKEASLCGQELGTELLSSVKNYRREFCLLFCDGLSGYTLELIQGLQSVLGRSFPFIGGGSSDAMEFKRTTQYFNESLLHQSAVASLFAGKLNYGIGIRHGWKPLGKLHTVTESKAAVIQKIDGRNAGFLYEDYFAKTLPELRKDILRINILYPLGIYLEGENEYLLRNVISLNNDGSITAQADIPQGSTIRLMIGTKESCLEAARQAALQVKTAMHGRKINIAIVVSSASRARLLGKGSDNEVEIIKEVLGKDTPLIGFYSYGEYAPLRATGYYGQTYLHNQTIAIVGIGE